MKSTSHDDGNRSSGDGAVAALVDREEQELRRQLQHASQSAPLLPSGLRVSDITARGRRRRLTHVHVPRVLLASGAAAGVLVAVLAWTPSATTSLTPSGSTAASSPTAASLSPITDSTCRYRRYIDYTGEVGPPTIVQAVQQDLDEQTSALQELTGAPESPEKSERAAVSTRFVEGLRLLRDSPLPTGPAVEGQQLRVDDANGDLLAGAQVHLLADGGVILSPLIVRDPTGEEPCAFSELSP